MDADQKAHNPEDLEQQNLILEEKRRECALQEFNLTQKSERWCNQTWDGVMCWPPTPAGQLGYQRCPSYVAGFHTNGSATRNCTEEGTWFVNPATNDTWTNLTLCFSGKTFDKVLPYERVSEALASNVNKVKTISQIGYCVSLVSLIAAFVILASFRRLRCPRNLLHMHLFVSFILRAFLSLLKDTLFVSGVGFPTDFIMMDNSQEFISELNGSWGCKVITTAWQFFIMTNYSWILMEGLYLHNLIFLALFSDTSMVTGYIALGWSLPLLNVVPWVIVRANLDDTLCWTSYENRSYALIIEVPIIIFMLVNFLLFLNIVRVLHLKLAATISEDNRRYRRWAKSTLVLAPLFGVHTTLLSWMSYIGASETVHIVWLYCEQIFCCFQGFFVAVLYCFMNGEVRTELAKKWDKARSSARWQYSLTEGPPADPGLGGGYPRRPSSQPSKVSPWLTGHFFGAARRKRNSTIETCVTTFNSTCNNVNNSHNQQHNQQPASGTDAALFQEKKRSPNSQYVDSQTDATPNKKLVCSV